MPENSEKPGAESTNLLRLTVDVAVSYFKNNEMAASEVPAFINMVHDALNKLESGYKRTESKQLKPAVSIRKSITDKHIICLEDGKQLKMLKRHLRTAYNLSPDEYRAKWNLPSDYPMVAPSYAAQRSAFAKQIGLGKGVTKRQIRPIKRANVGGT